MPEKVKEVVMALFIAVALIGTIREAGLIRLRSDSSSKQTDEGATDEELLDRQLNWAIAQHDQIFGDHL